MSSQIYCKISLGRMSGLGIAPGHLALGNSHVSFSSSEFPEVAVWERALTPTSREQFLHLQRQRLYCDGGWRTQRKEGLPCQWNRGQEILGDSRLEPLIFWYRSGFISIKEGCCCELWMATNSEILKSKKGTCFYCLVRCPIASVLSSNWPLRSQHSA